MNNNKIIIYGGTSYISRELLKILSKKFSKFIILVHLNTFTKNTGSFAERRASAGIFSPNAKAKIRSVGKLQKLRRTKKASRDMIKNRRKRHKDKKINPRWFYFD